jgi:hypothetical protein
VKCESNIQLPLLCVMVALAGCDSGRLPAPAPATAAVRVAVHAAPHTEQSLAPGLNQPSGAREVQPAGTTLAIVRVSSAGCELVRAVPKPELDLECSGRARFVVEDARTGEVLGEGACPWPTLCPCPREADHADGCVRRAHEAVARLKLPYHPGRAQRVRISTPAGEGWSEAGVFELPAPSTDESAR